jgi:hypothetical protein
MLAILLTITMSSATKGRVLRYSSFPTLESFAEGTNINSEEAVKRAYRLETFMPRMSYGLYSSSYESKDLLLSGTIVE